MQRIVFNGWIVYSVDAPVPPLLLFARTIFALEAR